MPRISVIIAVYNGASTIARAIQSVQSQNVRDIEIVVADDASKDETCEVVTALAAQDPRIKLVRQAVNSGAAVARNLAIQNATGTWVAILDADDWLEPGRFEAMLAAADATGADAVGDNMKIFDHAINKVVDETNFGSRRKIVTLTPEKLFRSDNPLRRHSIGYLQPMIKRAFLEEHNIRYPTEHRIGEDFLYLADVLLSGGKFVIIPDAYYVYRHMYSPTTRKKSAHSHTQDRFDLILRGCDELLKKYRGVMTPSARRALKRRRYLFEGRAALKDMLQAIHEKHYAKAMSILAWHPLIPVLLGAAAYRLAYANILNMKHSGEAASVLADDSIGASNQKVSIVIAVLNGMRTIERAIVSAQAQTEKNIEILVVDDGSSDGTPDFVEKLSARDGRIKCIRLEKNGGAAAATNIAIAQATGDWVMILDADDWIEPQRATAMLRAAVHAGADVVCDNLKIYDHALKRIVSRTCFGRSRGPMQMTTGYFFRKDNPVRRTAIGYLKPMVRRQFLLDHHITYDAAHRVGYDFLFLSEILLNGGHAVLIPGAYYDYVHMFSPTTRKKSPFSHTKNSYDQIIRGCDQLLSKYADRMTPFERKTLERRRYMFESRLHCNDMVAAWQDGRPLGALKTIIEWPFITVIVTAAVVKMAYANFLNMLWHLGLRRIALGIFATYVFDLSDR
ncbi:MAG TPA: glycosyltransferase family 2 protein [Alphaproteobacteria bacterium]|nr:glycosyltransferase family 2 protein [Alphaproteobacteria bacterium]